MPALIDRPKMTIAMYQALKRHIMRERERKKRAEEEADAELERQRHEQELKRKKEEEHSLTLEQTKDQLAQLKKELEQLKQRKHELFSELKKVLHQEDESRKRAQMKEQQNEMMLSHQYAQVQTAALTTSSGHPAMYYQGGRPAMYKPSTQVQQMAAIKRPRSPSPPPASAYQQFAAGDANKYTYSSSKPQHSSYHPAQKSGNYSQSSSSHTTYATQSNYPAAAAVGATPSGGKYPPNSSAFSSYATHYAQHQKSIADPYGQAGYPIPRLQQPGYHASLQQQIDSGSQKTTFPDDKFKPARGMPSQQTLLSQMPPISTASSKGSIVTGYPVRTQPQHPPSSNTGAYSSHLSTRRMY